MSSFQFFTRRVFLALGVVAVSLGLRIDSAEDAVAQVANGTQVGAPARAGEKAKFKDEVKSNAPAPKAVKDLQFTSKDGSQIKLADYIGKKNVVLVFTQGFNGMICPFCTTQTSRLIANYDKFAQRNCEVIVVYPGPDKHVADFVNAALKTEKEQVDRVPFPIVLDRDFKATDYFNIHSMQAHPSTYLIDKKGSIKLAYVGADNTADRPSVKALLKKIDELEGQAQGE